MTEHWTNRLSEYLDRELEPRDRAACEAHVSECPDCANALEELRGVVERAATLPDVPPARDLWPDIAARLPVRHEGAPAAAEVVASPDRQDGAVVPLGAGPAIRRRIAFTVPQLIAAAVALVALSASGMWLALPGGAASSGSIAASGPASVAGAAGAGEAATPAIFAVAWEAAVTELEEEFESRRSELDPETIRVVEQNLAIIDAAIAEANQALAEDPSSAFLNTHLATAMRKKVDLLRQVATIERTET